MKRMRKRIVSLLLALTMLLSVQVPTFAATAPEVKLNDMGLLLNISDAELDATLDRAVGITMILKSLGYTQADADAAALTTPFTDVSGWAKGWAALAYSTGITTGISATEFNPSGALTEKQFVAFQLRALQFDQSASWTYAVSLGKAAGLIDADNNLDSTTYTKRSAAKVMYNALSIKMQKAGITLIEKLVADGVVAEAKAEKYSLVETAFEVVGVSASDLKVVRVILSEDVDAESLTNDTIKVSINSSEMAYDEIYSNGVSANKYALKLQESSVVDIIFGMPNVQSDIARVEINGLKSTDGDVITGYMIDRRIRDTADPSVISVVGENQNIVKVTFNEPIQYKIGSMIFENAFIDDLRVVGTATMSPDARTIIYDLATPLTNGQHKLTIDPVPDYAGFSSIETTKNFTVVADNTAPYVVSAKAINRDEVVVNFNETIHTTKGHIKIGGVFYNIADTSKVTVEDTKVTIELDSPLDAAAAFNPVTAEYDSIEDLVGNSVDSATPFGIKAEVDDTAPTASAVVSSDNEIIVTFSEPVQFFTNLYFGIENPDGGGVNVHSVVASSSANTKFTVNLSNPLVDATTYKMTIMGIRDKSVFENRIKETELTLVMNDLKRPTVEEVRLMGDDVIRVMFSEAMNGSRLVDPIYYMFEDVSKNTNYPLNMYSGFTIKKSSDNTYVDITVPEVKANDKITVLQLKDQAGQLLDGFGDELTIQLSSPFILSDVTAKLIGSKTIELTADGHEFQVISADDFVVRTPIGDSLYHYVANAVIDSEDASKAILTLNADMGTDAKHNGLVQYLYLKDESLTMDMYNTKLEILLSAPLIVTDALKPTVTIESDTSDTLKINFSETVSASSDTNVISDLLIKESDGSIVPLTEGTNMFYSGGNGTSNFFDGLVITGLDGGESYMVEVVARFMMDGAGNPIVQFDNTTIVIDE